MPTMYWIKNGVLATDWELDKYHPITSIEVTAVNHIDHVMRLFRLYKERSSWQLEVVQPLRGYRLRFKTKRAAQDFVDRYDPALHDNPNRAPAFRGIDVRGYSTYGWLRHQPVWFDAARPAAQFNAGSKTFREKALGA